MAAMPLDGIRILDLSRLAPAYCTQLLGEVGADILQIEEATSTGGRQVTRPAFPPPPPEVQRRSRAYSVMGRNKRSIALNLRMEEARQVFYKLAETADVIYESFRPGVTKRLGVDYETIRKINPRIIYCSLTGFGQTGPYAHRPGHDINYTSHAGAQYMIGTPEKPTIPLNIVADFGGVVMTAYAIACALVCRERTGIGQYIDCAMTEAVQSLISGSISGYLSSGQVIEREGHNLNGRLPFYNNYLCGDDKWISIGCLEPYFFEDLCKGLELEEFLPHQWNAEMYPEMFQKFRERFRSKTCAEWFEKLKHLDVCVMPVYRLDEVVEDPHVKEREMVIELDHPEYGKVKQPGIPIKFSETPGGVRRFAPSRGQHTDEVLQSLGYSDEQIQELRTSGAVS